MGIGQAIGAAVSAVGGGIGGYYAQKSAEKAARKQYERERVENREILQNQIQWKTADAIKAGLHPLAALGVNPASGPSGTVVGDNGWAQNMGQNLGRAVEAGLSTEDKTAVQVAQLGIERARLENELVKTQIASQRMRNIQGSNPGLPMQLGPEVNGSIAIPGTGQRIKQEFPNLAQDAENAYGEIGGELFGISNLAVDAYRYLGLESILTRDDLTPALRFIGRAVSQDVSKGGYKSRYLQGR